MVNQTVFEYFRKNRGKYPLSALKEKALKAGYSEKDINDAIVMTEKKTEVPPESKAKNPEALLVYCSIVGIVFFLSFLVLFNTWVYFGVDLAKFFTVAVVSLISLLLAVYYFGFFREGLGLDSKPLKVSSISKIVLFVLLPVVYSFIRGPVFLSQGSASSVAIGFSIAYFLLFVFADYFFSIALFGLKDKRRFWKPASFFNLLCSVALTAIFVTLTVLYFKEKSFSFSIGSMNLVYWEAVVFAVFCASALFFEALSFFSEFKGQD